MLRQKEAIRILEATEQRRDEPGDQDLKRVRGGLLVQEPDRIDSEREKMQLATESSPSGTSGTTCGSRGRSASTCAPTRS